MDAALIQLEVAIRYPFRAESYLERTTAFSPVEVPYQWQHFNHFLETVTGESSDRIVNYFRRVSPMKGPRPACRRPTLQRRRVSRGARREPSFILFPSTLDR
jgi:hypothetical protein